MDRRKALRMVVVALALGLWGCGGMAGAGSGSSSSGRNTLTEADLEGMDNLSAFEAIRRLKPNWLRYRGQSVLQGPEREGLRIYLDGRFFGDAGSLEQIRMTDVQEIRFLGAREATLRWGTDHTVGALLITTRRDTM